MSKLKPLPKRLHNVLFHTHTVSGIVLSFVLFVIFFCGAVSFFKEEVYRWENPMARFKGPDKVDYDKVIAVLKSNNHCLLLDEGTTIIPPEKTNPFIELFYAVEGANGKVKRKNASIDPRSYMYYEGLPKHTTLINTIYRLHYLRQIPVIGIYISGFAGFFLIFAMVTGLLIHWKNIIEKFHAFQWKGKWKRIWTESHISLGFLTLPIQLIYGMSGALLGLSILLLLPSLYLFDGDREKIVEIIRPEFAIQYDKNASEQTNAISLNSLHKNITEEYSDFHIHKIFLKNFKKQDGTATVYYTDHKGIMGDGTTVFNLKDGAITYRSIPYKKSYVSSTYALLIKLHYVTFGGLGLKVIYFILALITCYVITSGNMLWYSARDNKKYSDKQRQFHFKTTKIYLSLTLGLVSAVALMFWGNKLIPLHVDNRVFYVNAIFFSGWLLFFSSGLLMKSFRTITNLNLILFSILSFGTPIFNGIITRDWVWDVFNSYNRSVAHVDITWFLLGIISMIILFKNQKREKTNEELA